jgi:hypothetical protein
LGPRNSDAPTGSEKQWSSSGAKRPSSPGYCDAKRRISGPTEREVADDDAEADADADDDVDADADSPALARPSPALARYAGRDALPLQPVQHRRQLLLQQLRESQR